jgi:hypothetical protein
MTSVLYIVGLQVATNTSIFLSIKSKIRKFLKHAKNDKYSFAKQKSVHVLMLENYNYAQSYEIKELFGRVECK